MILADTTLLIDFLRDKPSAVMAVQKYQARLFTTEINIFELIVGVYLSTVPTQRYLEKIRYLESQLVVLPLTRAATLEAGKIAGMLIKNGKKIEGTDSLIAGISMVNGIRDIITLNSGHFGRIPGINVVPY